MDKKTAAASNAGPPLTHAFASRSSPSNRRRQKQSSRAQGEGSLLVPHQAAHAPHPPANQGPLRIITFLDMPDSSDTTPKSRTLREEPTSTSTSAAAAAAASSVSTNTGSNGGLLPPNDDNDENGNTDQLLADALTGSVAELPFASVGNFIMGDALVGADSSFGASETKTATAGKVQAEESFWDSVRKHPATDESTRSDADGDGDVEVGATINDLMADANASAAACASTTDSSTLDPDAMKMIHTRSKGPLPDSPTQSAPTSPPQTPFADSRSEPQSQSHRQPQSQPEPQLTTFAGERITLPSPIGHFAALPMEIFEMVLESLLQDSWALPTLVAIDTSTASIQKALVWHDSPQSGSSKSSHKGVRSLAQTNQHMKLLMQDKITRFYATWAAQQLKEGYDFGKVAAAYNTVRSKGFAREMNEI